MLQSKTINPKTELALQIVKTAKQESGCLRYRNLRPGDYMTNSLLNEFRSKYVYIRKKYLSSRSQFENRGLSWQELKSVTKKILIEEMKECEKEDVDAFFGIRREGIDARVGKARPRRKLKKALSVNK